MSRRRLLRAALAWLAFHPGTARADDAQTLTVFAAADLAFAFRELASAFERATGARVTLVFGSTGNFAHQIRQGGPADVFFAADRAPRNYARLGFASIATDRIEPGIAALAAAYAQVTAMHAAAR